MKQNTERRVVITGLGVVAPNGIGKEAFWEATSKGVSGIKTIERSSMENLPIQVAGEINNFLANDYIERKLVNRTDRMTHFVFAATQEVLRDSNITLADVNPERVGAVISNTMGGIDFVMEQIRAVYTRGPRALSAYTAIAWLQVANVGQLAIRYGLQGYCKTPVNDAAGGLDAMTLAYRTIKRGSADVIIAGGCEAFIHPFILFVFAHDRDYYIKGNEPHAYRPFDRRAAGMVVAEGAALCLLEEYEHARQRGAHIYGEIVGYGQTNDAHGLQAPSDNGKHYARAIRMAMQEGNLAPEDIAYFSLDGRALPASDRGEADALRRAFGDDLAHVPVSVPRTMLGHSFAAAGALDTVTALLALEHETIPPTINCEQLDPAYDLPLVRDKADALHGSAVLIGERAIGGSNVVLALKK